MPEIRTGGSEYPMKLARILTPEGNLWLWSVEYTKCDISKYLQFVGEEYSLSFFGADEGQHVHALHYIMSRGIPKAKAYQLLLPQLKSQDICYLLPDEEVQGYFSESGYGYGLSEVNHERRNTQATKSRIKEDGVTCTFPAFFAGHEG